MTYLGSFWDLNGSFWGPEGNILLNKVQVDNVHWLSFPKRYHKPILQKVHKMTYLGVFLGPKNSHFWEPYMNISQKSNVD